MSSTRFVFVRTFVLIAATVLLASCQNTQGRLADDSAADPSTAAPALLSLDGFLGTWMNTDAFGQATDEVVSEFRYTAGGSAIAETMFPGADHEMVTMYYVSPDAMYLTHYCAIGNHPTLTAHHDDNGDLVFDCVGNGANFGSCPSTDHMHSVHYQLEGDMLTASWRSMMAGELTEPLVFKLKRKS